MSGDPPTTVVVPTVGRHSLRVLLEALAVGTTELDVPVVVADDRAGGDDLAASLADVGLRDLRVLRTGGVGPAAARNVGWRHTRTPWVSFLDDDVVPHQDWYAALHHDLTTAPPGVVGSQGRVRVPLPEGRRPTDWERTTAGLAHARWITADMSFRRCALSLVGGFDERFPRAFREDADLALRVTRRVGEIARGSRGVDHPVRPADDWVSVRQQAGNADDFLMRALHGRNWRDLVGAPRGRRRRHVLVTVAAAVAVTGLLTRRPLPAAAATTAWLAGTAELAWARIAPGPRDRAEVRRMLVTSAVLPVAATWHSARGMLRHRRARPWQGPPELVLFDRDDTLVHDVPYNGDPAGVRPVAGAADAVQRLRRAGLRVGVVTNQSGVGRGLLTLDDVAAVNARVDSLLGPFDTWQVCAHAPEDECSCRKPAPGMVRRACARLGVAPDRCVVVGDIGGDVEAARAAGARGLLVPTRRTRPEEVAAAAETAADLTTAVDLVLEGVR